MLKARARHTSAVLSASALLAGFLVGALGRILYRFAGHRIDADLDRFRALLWVERIARLPPRQRMAKFRNRAQLCKVVERKESVVPRSRNKEQRIRERAYLIWEEEGRPSDKAKEHWDRARAEIEEEDGLTSGDQDFEE